MTLKQFKWVDLLLFSLVATIFEVVNHFASVNLPSFKLMFMSFTVVLTLISMYRWGAFGLIVMLFSTIIQVAVTDHNADGAYYATYVCGSILGMLPGYIIFQIIIGKKRLKKNYIIIPYLLFDFVLVILFRSIIMSLFDLNNFYSTFINCLQELAVQECMSIFISIIILVIANRKKGNIIVEMNKYIEEVHELKKLGGLKEMKEKPNFNSDSSFTEYGQIDNSTILDGGTLNEDQLKDLLKMYDESANIKIDNPLDCLTEKQGKKDKNA